MKKASKKAAKAAHALADRAPIAESKAQKGSQPKLSSHGKDVVIRHREFIGNLVGTDTFTVLASLGINPGDSGAFPWLSKIARNFEQYEFLSLKFEYLPRCATTQPGGVYLAVDPKSADSAPYDETIIGSYGCLVEDAPWKRLNLTVPSSITRRRRYVRIGSAGNVDATLYDAGRLHMASVGFGGNLAAGKLFVDYEVVLQNPSLLPTGSVESMTLDAAGGGNTLSKIWGNSPVGLGSLFVKVDGNKIYLQGIVDNAKYGGVIHVIGTGLTGCALATAGTRFTANTQIIALPAGGTMLILFWTVTSGPHEIDPTRNVLEFTVTGSTVTNADLIVTRLSPQPSF